MANGIALDVRPPAWIDDWEDQGESRIEAACALMESDGHVLLDIAFAPGLMAKLRGLALGPLHPLYAGRYGGEGLDKISPVLFSLPYSALDRQAVFRLLQEHCAGRPMLSLLDCDLPTLGILAHLRRNLEAMDADGRRFLVRLADTRALGAIFNVLTTAQIATLLGRIRTWWYLDHKAIFVAETSASVDGWDIADVLLLSQSQRADLDRLALPDALLFRVRARPDIYGTLVGQPSEWLAAMRLVEAKDGIEGVAIRQRMLDSLRKVGLLIPRGQAGTENDGAT